MEYIEFKRVLFESPYYGGTEVIVGLTETDSEGTFQNFLENAFTAFQQFIVDRCEGEIIADIADENGDYSESDYVKAVEKYEENCYISSISDIPENEALWCVGTDDYGAIDW